MYSKNRLLIQVYQTQCTSQSKHFLLSSLYFQDKTIAKNLQP
uniref:Uncharacterized protein n=1 Tax=virus sp. ctx9V1 TaxID=2828001 RepID=A0A8S5REJ7_9VIRU|nr:MAG TPA: hypothetical protein [virus sp. ctx9V1]